MAKMKITSHQQDQELHAYNTLDVIVPATLWGDLLAEAKELGVWDYFNERMLPLAREVLRMQARGMPFHIPTSLEVEKYLAKDLEKNLKQIAKATHPGFNPDALADIIDFLFSPKPDGLGLKVGRRTKVRQDPQVDEEQLLKYKDKVLAAGIEHPIFDLILEYRELNNMFTEYVKGPQEKVDPDGRMRSRLLIHVTPTTRLASRDPNLQNQPKRCNPEVGKKIRNQYQVPAGWEIWEQDLQAAEKRIAYIESGDTLGLERLHMYDKLTKEGKHEEAARYELHKANALDAFGPFGLKFEDITPRLRDFMKNVSYGEGYGGSAETMDLPPDLLVMLKKITGMPPRDAVKAAMNNYRKKHPREQAHRERTISTVMKTRQLRDENYGTLRIFLGHMKEDIRAALNDPCQRGVARIMNDALRRIGKETPHKALGPKSDPGPILQVHDAFLWEVYTKGMSEKAALNLREQLDALVMVPQKWTSGVTACIPTEWKRGQAWGSLKDWK